LTKRYTENVAAYQAYAKADAWNKRTREGLRQSVDHFKQALDLDPTYGLRGIGEPTLFLFGKVNFSPLDSQATAATRALIWTAHWPKPQSLAFIKFWYDWDFKERRRSTGEQLS
jgi:hypothetical protein